MDNAGAYDREEEKWWEKLKEIVTRMRLRVIIKLSTEVTEIDTFFQSAETL